MQTVNETLELILGEKAISYYLASFFFSTIAILIMLYVGAQKRDVDSSRTPVQFSFWFLLYDNAKKALATYALLFLGYRFLPEFQMEWAVGLGLAASAGVVFLLNTLAEWIPGFKKFIQVKKDQ